MPTTVGGGVFGGTTRTSVAGRYRLVRSIGAGGHAEVWEAIDGLSAARVALKLLPQVQGPERARVRREIAALRRLCVPGVVRLLDEGVDGDLAYLAMELVEGAPFPGSRGPRPWASLEGVAVALLETLSRIHALGLVHRDMKPGNVLVRADGFPTVLDFGVSLGSVSSNTPLTQDGQILGTPAYLSPEQIQGRAITPAADLYAVGVMLYEALSGRLPHPAPLVHGTFYARLTQRPPSLSDVAPEVPAHVSEAVAAMLEIEPERRPRSAAEAIDRLRGHAEAHLRSPLLPRLGEDVLRELIDAASTDRPVDLVGDRGTGRSRLLDDLSRALEAHGRAVLRTAPSRQPFGSLEPVVGPLDPHAESSLDVVVRAVREGLAAKLRERAVLLVDDVERVDVWSADVIDRLRCDGAVVRVFLPDGHADPATTLELKPLSEADLRPLFRGPERLFHLTSDAARALHARTGGHPARVSAELGAWRRAGLARVDGDRFVVDRDTLDRLDAHTRLMPPVRSSELQHELPPHLYDLLRWISLAWPHGSVELLSRAMRQPRWRVAAEAEELVRRGLAQRSRDGRLEPLRTTLPEQYWDFSQHLRAHRALAEALPPGTDGRLHHVLAGGPASDTPEDYAALAREVVREAVGFGLRRARDGWLGHATAILGESLLGVRELTNDAPSAEMLAPLLGLWAEVALADGTPQALDRALYEISKLSARGEALDRIEALLRAALAVGQGGERALQLVEAIAPFDDPWLERRRLGVRVMAARRCSSDRRGARARA
ncbi:MAG: serine/threonine-protein kinase [Polyangiales bacterium]